MTLKWHMLSASIGHFVIASTNISKRGQVTYMYWLCRTWVLSTQFWVQNCLWHSFLVRRKVSGSSHTARVVSYCHRVLSIVSRQMAKIIMDSPENMLRVALQYTCVKVHHECYAIREAWSNDVGNLLYDIKKSRKQCRLSSCMCATGCRATSYCNYSYNKSMTREDRSPRKSATLLTRWDKERKNLIDIRSEFQYMLSTQ